MELITGSDKALLATFYDLGEVEDSPFAYRQMDSHVGPGFPVKSKLALAVVALVIDGLVVHRVLRRKAAQS
jgi:hypothetical protein